MTTTENMETKQYLTFQLDEEIFALDISKVREVLEFKHATRVPRTPPFMRGVVNLRGRVVPVVDMRIKFGMSKTERTINTCIIIVEVSLDGETAILGALADSVQEVITLGAEEIEPPPKIGMHLNTDFIQGMGKKNETFLILLNIDRIFSSEELVAVRSVHDEPAENQVHESGA